MSGFTGTQRGYRHAALGPIVAAATGSLVLAFSLSPAFAVTTSHLQQFLATDTGLVTIGEAIPGGSAACSSSSLGTEAAAGPSCTGIDLYGGKNLQPGTTSTTTVVFTNTGTGHAHTFTASGGQCTQSAQGAVSGSASDLCSKFRVRISTGAATVFDGSAAEFGRSGALSVVDADSGAAIPAGGSVAVTVSVTLSTDIDNTYAGLSINQPITWTFQD